MQTYSFGMCPEEIIKQSAIQQCPNGYPMKIVDKDEWKAIIDAVNLGIDSHLEAITERSMFDNGFANVHPEELHVLLRRLYESDNDAGWDLRGAILSTLDIEEV